MLAFLTTFFLFFLHFVSGSKVVTIRQDAQRFGAIEQYNDGKVVASSNVDAFQFYWPSIEMTSNTKDKEVYVVAFVDTSPNPILYLLNSTLQVQFQWDTIPYWFFDLQYSTSQNTLYGVYVASTFGRVISQFIVNKQNSSDIEVKEIFPAPYMWYINASTIDQSTNTYYALLNYFPGQPGYTPAQKLAVVQLTDPTKPKSSVYDIKTSNENAQYITAQFIGFSVASNELFFAGFVTNESTAVVGTLDTLTGCVKKTFWTADASLVGPLVVDDSTQTLSVYTLNVSGKKWQLWSLNQKSSEGTIESVAGTLVQEYEVNSDLRYFVAASIGF